MESLETNLVYPPSRENYAPVIWNPRTTLRPPPTRLTGALHATRDPIQSLKLPVFKTNKTLSNIRNLFIALPSGSVCYSFHKRSLSYKPQVAYGRHRTVSVNKWSWSWSWGSSRGWTHFLEEFLTDETCMCCSMFSLEDFPLLRVTKLGPGDIPGNFWWACAARFSKSWLYFRLRKCYFPHPFSDLVWVEIKSSFLD